MAAIRAGLCAAILATTVPLGAREPLEVDVSPHAAQAPSDVLVQATIEADEANRAIEVAADSGGYYRSSTMDLDGARAACIHTIYFRQLPRGDYVVRVTLYGAGGRERATVRRLVLLR